MSKIVKTIMLIATPILAIVALGFLFYPLLNPESSVKESQPNIEYVVNWWNPIKPKITSITKLNDNEGYWVIISDYWRTGINEFTYAGEVNGKPKSENFGQIDAKIQGKSLEEVKSIVNKQDLSKTKYTPEKSSVETAYIEELKKPVECQRAIRVENIYNEIDLKIYKNMKYSELSNFSGEGKFDDKNNYFLVINLENNIKYNLYFGKISPAIDNSIELTKVTKVYADCSEIEIPLPDKPL